MRIGWILSGSRAVAGARLHGWNIHERLLKRGYDSNIIFAPKGFNAQFNLSKEVISSFLSAIDVLIIQKIHGGDTLEYLITESKKREICIMYICIDRVNTFIADNADLIVVVSDNLKMTLSKENQKKAHYVFDGYEQDPSICKKHTPTKEITLVYVSNNTYNSFPQLDSLPNGVSLKIIGPPKERVKKYHPTNKFFADTSFDFSYVIWDESTVTEELLAGDVGVIPYPDELLETPAILNKSNNRLIYLMSLGIPVITSPLPEYIKLIIHGKNGFIATSKGWEEFIILLRDNPLLRKEIGLAAKKTVQNLSVNKQADEYEKLLKKL